jgi:homopolymeric O-antigen transport system permease protein
VTVVQPPEEQVTVIRPPSGWAPPNLRELWHSADLVYFLAKRDVTIRYRQTAIGVLWAVLQPLILTAIFAIFLGRLAKVPSDGVPYALFALTGMTMWLFLSGSISKCSESTVASAALISKVYFPRLVVPIAALMPPLVDFAVAFVVLVAALLISGEGLQVQILLVPVVLGVAAMLTLGIGLWLSAIIVRFRDVTVMVPFALMVILWTSPILYPLSLIPEGSRDIYALNPFVGLLETFRWTVLPGAASPGLLLLVPAVMGLVLLVSGALYFGRAERRFADVI